MTTSVTFALATVPLPADTTHVCHGDVGWLSTVTEYASPLATDVGNVNVPFALIIRLSPRLFCSTTELPSRPVMVPPTVKWSVAHVTVTPVTFDASTVPDAFATVHVCVGPPGCFLTVTLKAAPLATGVANANAPSALIVRSSPPLFWRTSPVPTRPVT